MVRLIQILGAAALLSSSVLAAPAVRRTNHGEEASDSYQKNDESYKQPAQYGQDKPSDKQYAPPSYDNTKDVKATPMMEKETPSSMMMDEPKETKSVEATPAYEPKETKSVEATPAYEPKETKSVEATSAPTYGSGQSNWGKSYEDCVSKCVAQYGAPPQEWAPSESMPPPEGTGAVHTVMVAPMKGVLRYWPFAVNATVGDTIRYVWTQAGANHTATLSSALTICNKSGQAEKLKWVSGVRNASNGPETFDVTLTTNEQQFFYCSVLQHCAKGMFGMVQPKMGGNNTVSGNMEKWLSNSPDLKAAWAAVHEKTKGTPADTWGNNINIDDVPEEAHADLAQNVIYSRAMFAANPGSLEANSATTKDGSPLQILPDLNTLLTATNQDPSANSVPPGTPTSSVPEASAVASQLAQSTTPATPKSAGFRTSVPVWVAAFIGAVSFLVL